jgi:GGDEF domain-containing protein
MCRRVTGALEEQILDRDEDVDAHLQTREPTLRQLYTTLKFEVRRNYHLGQEVTTLRAMMARLGGDEYACLITGVSSRDRLQHIASTLFASVSAPFKIGALTLNVRPSIGIAVCPSDGTTTDDLMRVADTAMYGAKRKRSSFSFSERPYPAPHLNIAAASTR